ncbi:hypothetical protein [Phocaeicola sp.]
MKMLVYRTPLIMIACALSLSAFIPGGDDRYINNLFAPVRPGNADAIRGSYGLDVYNKSVYPMLVEGNVYCNRAIPFVAETEKLVADDMDPAARIEENGDGVYLSLSLPDMSALQTSRVNTERLGKARLPRQYFEYPDGSPVEIDSDYVGAPRGAHPVPGPLENVKQGSINIKVW